MNQTEGSVLESSTSLQPCILTWDEDSSTQYICHLCQKSFYNEMALQNHKNIQHDIRDSGSDEESNSISSNKLEQDMEGLCGFKFIPFPISGDHNQSTRDGLTTRLFSEDTSYLFVKVEGEDVNMDPLKNTRYMRMFGKNTSKRIREPVDISGPFTCTFPSSFRADLQCRQIFFNCCEYSIHYRDEHTKRRKASLRCQVCEKRLDRDFSSTLSTQATSTAQYHTANSCTFSCRICEQTFVNSVEYDQHRRIVHAKTKPHECSVCSKRFTQQGGLQQHMRMHSGIRPFVCTFCPKAFTQKAGLDQHLRTHTKVKPFKCVICSKCFSQSIHLRQHMRTHTNIQPFECAICRRRFKQSSHLNFHMRSHFSQVRTLAVEPYAHIAQQHDQLDFLNFANLQPVQDGETLYYAADLASSGILPDQSVYAYQSQAMAPANGISF